MTLCHILNVVVVNTQKPTENYICKCATDVSTKNPKMFTCENNIVVSAGVMFSKLD